MVTMRGTFLIALVGAMACVLVGTAGRVAMRLVQLQSFANLATVSAASLADRIPCTGDPPSQAETFAALKRHVRLTGSCDADQIGFDCWKKVFHRQAQRDWQGTFRDLLFLSHWCHP